MDLRLPDIPASADEAAALTALLGDAGTPATVGLAWAKDRRHLLLEGLHALQRRVGWISPGGLGDLCRRLHVPPAEAYGVASFYALFRLQPAPPVVHHVCEDVVCKARGADALIAACRERLGPPGVARDGRSWQASPCLGLCDAAPAVMRTEAGPTPREDAFGHATLADVVANQAPVRTPVITGGSILRLLGRVGRVDPSSLRDFLASGGFAGLDAARALGPEAVVAAVAASGLQGRGGAAFPTGRKWAAVAAQPARPHWIVCDADESEPGTFKDRVLLEEDPFTLVEALCIAGLAVHAERAIVYLRGEYPLAHERLGHAIATCRAAGLLGNGFDIEVRRGAGAYICGEETALFNSIEGFRGEPRSKPPFPVERGLFGLPTLINNVETLANVPWILRHGVDAYRSVGTTQSPGTRLFCLCGHVALPGLYEVPMGTTLRDLLAQAGGPVGEPGAILLGGAAGTFVGPEALDLHLSFEGARAAGATLGSGVVAVFDRNTDLRPMLRRVAAFFRDESCGQCVPCRVGTVRQEELLGRIATGRCRATDRALFDDLDAVMRDASICGLGQTASSATASALRRWPELWERT